MFDFQIPKYIVLLNEIVSHTIIIIGYEICKEDLFEEVFGFKGGHE